MWKAINLKLQIDTLILFNSIDAMVLQAIACNFHFVFNWLQ